MSKTFTIFRSGSNSAGLTSSHSEKSVFKVSVTDKRIVVIDESDSSTKTRTVDDNKHNGSWFLCCCCCCGDGATIEAGSATAIMVSETIYQASDLKECTFTISEFQTSAVKIVGAGAGCCSGSPVAPQESMAKSPTKVVITLTFVKKVGDFFPSWTWKGDIKTSYTTVVLEGEMTNMEEATALKRSLMDHTELQKPSQPGAQSIVINAGADSDGGFLMGGLSGKGAIPGLGGR